MTLRPLATSVCLALSVVGCTPESEPVSQFPAALGTARVATVNGQPVPESLFRYYVINVQRKNPDALNNAERTQAIEELVQLQLLVDEARARGLPNERTIAAELALQQIQLIARHMALRYLEQNPATDAEVQAMYERLLPQLAPLEYKTRHILVESEAEATSAIEQLQEGADFAELARQVSKGPTSTNGGDLGWLTAQSMVPSVAEAIQALEPGAFSTAPVPSDFGFHVLLLEEVRQQQAPALESIRADLAAAVDREKLEAYISSIREGATVETTAAP